MTLKLKAKNFFVQFRIIVLLINCILRLKNGAKFNFEIHKRKSLSIFDIEELSNDLGYPTDELVFDNNMYGIGYWLKKYAGIKKPLNTYIEHGVFLGDYIEIDEKNWYVKSISTFSKQREMHLKGHNVKKDIHLIGPYIHYADFYTSYSEFLSLKQKLGRTLLIFPSHSTKNLLVSDFTKQLINYVNEVRHNFNTIIVNLYYIDARNKNIVKSYAKEGYLLTCAGHKFDSSFMSRLKTIISLADMTASNSSSIGTHIGYCISMNKPHHIFETKTILNSRNNVGTKLLSKKNEIRESEIAEIHNIFRTFSNTITIDQIDIVDKYWGLKHIKTKTELFDLLN